MVLPLKVEPGAPKMTIAPAFDKFHQRGAQGWNGEGLTVCGVSNGVVLDDTVFARERDSVGLQMKENVSSDRKEERGSERTHWRAVYVV